MTWTLADETDVATVGRILTAKDAPTKGLPTLRPRADAVVVLVAASTDRPSRWASVKRAVEDDVGPELPVYVLLVGPLTDAWENSSSFDAVASLGEGAAVTDAAVHLSNAFPAGIEHFGLALMHRPVLLFDADEPVPRPLSIERKFDKDAVRQCPDDESGGECSDVVRNPARLTSPGTHLVITEEDDLDGLAKRERTAFEQGATELGGRPLGDGSRIYVNPFPAGVRDALYSTTGGTSPTTRPAPGGARSAAPGSSSGHDLLRPRVRLGGHHRRTGAPAGVGADRAHYAQHESVVRYDWRRCGPLVRRTFEDYSRGYGIRPPVFVARGTHAGIARARRRLPTSPRGPRGAVHDGGLWVANNAELCLRRVPPAAPDRLRGPRPGVMERILGPWGTRRLPAVLLRPRDAAGCSGRPAPLSEPGASPTARPTREGPAAATSPTEPPVKIGAVVPMSVPADTPRVRMRRSSSEVTGVSWTSRLRRQSA